MLRCLVIAALLLVCGALSAEENWPQFRGARGDCFSDAKGLPATWSETEHVKWKTPLHDKGWSSPVVWGDQIWVTAAPEDGKSSFAICVDKNSGKILHDIKLWENEKVSPLGNGLNGYASCTPVVEGGR